MVKKINQDKANNVLIKFYKNKNIRFYLKNFIIDLSNNIQLIFYTNLIIKRERRIKKKLLK